MLPFQNITTHHKLFFFFFLNFWRTHVRFVGPLIPCFGLLVTSALGFKARVDSLACFLACAPFLRFTSGATPADLLTASMAAEPLWPMYLQPSDVSTSIGGVKVGAAARTYGLGPGSNLWPTVPQHSTLNHSTIPARQHIINLRHGHFSTLMWCIRFDLQEFHQ